MTGESARVVHPYSPRIVQTFKEAQVAFRADPEGNWIRRDDYERLLSGMEALADSWGRVNSEWGSTSPIVKRAVECCIKELRTLASSATGEKNTEEETR